MKRIEVPSFADQVTTDLVAFAQTQPHLAAFVVLMALAIVCEWFVRAR